MSSAAAAMIDSRDTSLRVWTLGSADTARWDAFVMSCPDATFFHQAGWKNVIENVFGHETYYLLAESSSGIEGVLPLGRVKSWLFGDALISVPFGVYGGVAALNANARALLEDEAERLAVSLGRRLSRDASSYGAARLAGQESLRDFPQGNPIGPGAKSKSDPA